MSTTDEPESVTYYERGLAVSDALAHDETLRVEFDSGAHDLAGRDLFDEWNDLAPGEPFKILGRVDEGGELRPIDWEALKGAPSGYRPGRVTMDVVDDAPSIPAFVSAWHRWNGWAVPIFTRETLIASADALRELFPDAYVTDSEGVRLTFDADGFPILTDVMFAPGGSDYDPEHPDGGDMIVPIVIDGVTYYDIGGGGYVWQDARRDHEHYYDSARSAWQCRYCGTAIEDCTRDA
ncbi:hypothetical protein [Microbacterium trichothecenolyticum]|uniref:Uncharacterized protein n=1 Tax=Microbacterium trichothecenolyticum TaxID=69370 RepID=A0A0M2HFV8_MICTR|nr:hypothetical protein [Microbacterium trichothecenolyticum]KJL45562.1 hypothetical protein RS82_00114 [Microbacterium trichothecenolyticum]